MKRYIKLLLVAAFFVVSGMIYSCNVPIFDEEDQSCTEAVVIETIAQTITEASGTIYVYICGEVISPGVYELPAGSRLYELVEVAGGFTDKAAKDRLNLAEKLIDTQMVTVLSVDDMADAGDSQTAYDDGLIDINSAGVSELTSLPGIGEVRAKDIIAYREQQGSFSTPEDIMKVPGIKTSVYEKIKDLITVN